MNVKTFDSYESYEEWTNKRTESEKDWLNTPIIVKEKNRICADMETNCKTAKTAVKRFAAAFEEYPLISEWIETLEEVVTYKEYKTEYKQTESVQCDDNGNPAGYGIGYEPTDSGYYVYVTLYGIYAKEEIETEITENDKPMEKENEKGSESIMKNPKIENLKVEVEKATSAANTAKAEWIEVGKNPIKDWNEMNVSEKELYLNYQNKVETRMKTMKELNNAMKEESENKNNRKKRTESNEERKEKYAERAEKREKNYKEFIEKCNKPKSGMIDKKDNWNNQLKTLETMLNDKNIDRNNDDFIRSLYNVGTMVTHSVVNKLLSVTGNPYIFDLKNDISRNTKHFNILENINKTLSGLEYDNDGNIIIAKKSNYDFDKTMRETLSESFDLVQTAIAYILEIANNAIKNNTDFNFEREFEEKRLIKEVWFTLEESENCYKTVTTNNIRNTHKTVREYIDKSGNPKWDNSKYTYIEDMISSDNNIDNIIYFRSAMYADLEGNTVDLLEGKRTITEYFNENERIEDKSEKEYNALVEKLSLTDRQYEIFKLREKGLGYKAIARVLNISPQGVAKNVNLIKAKAEKLGYKPYSKPETEKTEKTENINFPSWVKCKKMK